MRWSLAFALATAAATAHAGWIPARPIHKDLAEAELVAVVEVRSFRQLEPGEVAVISGPPPARQSVSMTTYKRIRGPLWFEARFWLFPPPPRNLQVRQPFRFEPSD
jgi:hypothetical protein